MGLYINPKDMTKEQFLIENGTQISHPLPAKLIPQDKILVCLVYNAAFTAAGVVFNDYELEAFTSDTDLRKKEWFVLPIDVLPRVCDPRKLAWCIPKFAEENHG